MSTSVGPAPKACLPDVAAALPDDPAILQQMIHELVVMLRQLRLENEQLQHRLDLLLRRLYGLRTERFDPNQPLLIPDAFDPAEAPPSRDDTSAESQTGDDATGTPKTRQINGYPSITSIEDRSIIVITLTRSS
jgi:transposase